MADREKGPKGIFSKMLINRAVREIYSPEQFIAEIIYAGLEYLLNTDIFGSTALRP